MQIHQRMPQEFLLEVPDPFAGKQKLRGAMVTNHLQHQLPLLVIRTKPLITDTNCKGTYFEL
jgi:hypothetical protein